MKRYLFLIAALALVAFPGATPAPAAAVASAASAQSSPSSGSDRRGDRADVRELKHERFVASVDSLVASRRFVFMPNSMQESPGGYEQLIYNAFYYVAVKGDSIEVHIPAIRGGLAEVVEMINFDAGNLQDYRRTATPYGWSVTFDATAPDRMTYSFDFNVYTVSGQTILMILSPVNSVKYIGNIQPLDFER
ncbi:MAG: DUF4251 domain-containing protein [Rikenellaceae bacterium]|nr:DUF4251 domain-containing protein [Rikenellaceae bacterium]